MADATVRRRAPLLVFIHIPKTAGTTLRWVLNMNEPGRRTLVMGNVFKGGGGVDTQLVERLRTGEGPTLRGVKLVRGHVPLGVREYLSQRLAKGRQLSCFTFLREPVDRTLSHYFQILNVSERPTRFSRAALPADATLGDALESGYLLDNLQTRMLSGLAEPFGEVTDDMLEQAKSNLRDDLTFFGLSERFDESLLIAKQRLGLRTILYVTSDRVNRVNTSRPRGDEVPEEIVRAAERCNHYDIELYRYAEELFQSAPELGQLEFEVGLAALRAAQVDGEVEPAAPVPASFGGDEKAWRMLIHARATSERLEAELAHRKAKGANDRARARRLAQELETVSAKTKKLEQEVERLGGASSRIEELEREVERLRTARARTKRSVSQKAARAGVKRNAKRGGPQESGRHAGLGNGAGSDDG